MSGVSEGQGVFELVSREQNCSNLFSLLQETCLYQYTSLLPKDERVGLLLLQAAAAV